MIKNTNGPGSPFSFAIRTGEPLAPFTYIKIGGPAEYLVVVKTRLAFITAIREALQQGMPFQVLGGASNVLISDTGLSGLTILNRVHHLQIDSTDPQLLHVSSGTLVNQLVNFTTRHGLAGLENFLGIPGTVGGAIYNNSHYLADLFGDHIITVEAITPSGDMVKIAQTDCHFAYDASVFQTNGAIILSAVLRLERGDPQLLSQRAAQALKRRRDTQPLAYPSSGCMFQNPAPAICQRYHLEPCAAGYLIDQAGLKGVSVGGAQVSSQHANFIINTGSATASDVIALSQQVQARVRQRFHLTLEREIFLLGDHGGVE